MSTDTIFTKKIDTRYRREPIELNFKAFEDVLKSRRSVRVFTDEIVPDEVIQISIEHGLLAPNSSNLQPWEFHWVKSKEKRSLLAKYCFSQNGAKTASHLIVCVAKTNTWKKNCKRTLDDHSDTVEEIPSVIKQYYQKIAPFAYGLMGPLGILSPFKWVLLNTIGLFQVMSRGPIWPSDLITWATKTTALACENIMLSIRAQGFDSLAMEGFDESRVKKLLKLKRHDHVTMIIAVGKCGEKGIYSPQIRFPKDEFIIKH